MVGGWADFLLPWFRKKGTYGVKGVHLGSDLAKKVTRTIEIKVVKKN